MRVLLCAASSRLVGDAASLLFISKSQVLVFFSLFFFFFFLLLDNLHLFFYLVACFWPCSYYFCYASEQLVVSSCHPGHGTDIVHATIEPEIQMEPV